MAFLLTLGVVFLILLFAEYLSRRTNMHSELTRKFVHMAVGTFAAFWPFFLSWRQIEMLSAGFLLVILLSIKFTVFRSIHTVPRKAIGEILFAAVIGFLALLSSSEWIFMAAMLHLSLGDGIAAIAGLLWGDGNQYKVFGKIKSIAGSGAFLVVSLLIMIAYVAFSDATANIITLAIVPLLAMTTENVAVNGTDNLIMPILVALLLGGTG